MPTRSDVITKSLQRLAIVSLDEAPTPYDEAYVGEVLDSLFAELPSSDGISVTWTLEETPQAALVPLANLLATEIAPHYVVPSESRFTALVRLRRALIEDNRSDERDLDDDGVVSDDEVAAAARAEFF